MISCVSRARIVATTTTVVAATSRRRWGNNVVMNQTTTAATVILTGSTRRQLSSSSATSIHHLPPPLMNCELDVKSETYQDAMKRTNEQVNELNQHLDFAKLGGGGKAVERHLQRSKLMPRDRIRHLCDPGTPVLELSALAGNNIANKDTDENIPSGGIVTAIGKVSGQLCMIISNDPTYKGGTYFPITVKKHLRAQEIALQNDLPCIYLVDSGGAFLPKQADVFPDKEHFGRIFYNQATMSAQNIPQVAVICGSCTAGGAYIPSMSDESIIVQGNGTIFLGGPPLVKAATGEVVTAEDLGGARVHAEVSGVVDHIASTELEALQKARDVMCHLGRRDRTTTQQSEGQQENCWEEPLYDPSELGGIFPLDSKKTVDIRLVLARILDGSRFHEFKANYGKTLVTGFGKIMGEGMQSQKALWTSVCPEPCFSHIV
jgi:3-methylcrotonyl-CoA carboxylase beta subunit